MNDAPTTTARTILHDLLDVINEWGIVNHLDNDEANDVVYAQVKKQHAEAAKFVAECDPAVEPEAIAHILRLVETFDARLALGRDVPSDEREEVLRANHEAEWAAREYLGAEFRSVVFIRDDGVVEPEEGGYGRYYIRRLDGSLVPFEDFIKVNAKGFVSVSAVPVPKLAVVADESSEGGRSTSASVGMIAIGKAGFEAALDIAIECGGDLGRIVASDPSPPPDLSAAEQEEWLGSFYRARISLIDALLPDDEMGFDEYVATHEPTQADVAAVHLMKAGVEDRRYHVSCSQIRGWLHEEGSLRSIRQTQAPAS